MPALNFKKRFAPDVEAGRKRQTIRKRRKRPIKVGEKLYLYTGMRTQACRKLGEAVCKKVRHICIVEGLDPWTYKIIIDGREISAAEEFRLARADGFEDSIGIIDFFRKEYGLPFEGHIYNW